MFQIWETSLKVYNVIITDQSNSLAGGVVDDGGGSWPEFFNLVNQSLSMMCSGGPWL